ncbi:MAG: radical SAM protein [Candidatus Omnitrophica bacterium]|nr:radical SAM protein [Candidatus Omnitrophota bacterium]
MSISAIDSIRCRFNYPYRALRNKLLGRSDPLIVILVVNNECNLKCRYCFGQYCARKAGSDFNTAQIISIVDELHALGTRVLTVHGGETLLRDDIGEIVDYIKKKGMYIHLVTNGLLLKQKIGLIRKVDSLCISFDGRQEGHEANRGAGTFKPTLEAIKLAKREGFRLRIHATITKYTKDDIEYLAKLAREIGFFQYFSILYQCGGVTREFQELMLSDEETKDAIRQIIHWKKKGYPIFTSYRVLENALNWPYPYIKPHLRPEEIPARFKPIDCFYGKSKFIIDADGRVYPCFALMDEFKPLNIKEVGLKRAIEHVRDAKRCSSCMYFTNNDHNLLLGLSIRQLLNQCKLQFKELIGRY